MRALIILTAAAALVACIPAFFVNLGNMPVMWAVNLTLVLCGVLLYRAEEYFPEDHMGQHPIIRRMVRATMPAALLVAVALAAACWAVLFDTVGRFTAV